MLTSLKSFHGAAVEASDGAVGRVARFVLELDQWAVRYLVVDAGGWWQGHEVLVSPMSIEGTAGRLAVSLSREQIKNSPPYEAVEPITPEREAALLGHYGYPVYWAGPFLWGPAPSAAEARAKNAEQRARKASATAGTAVLEPKAGQRQLADSRVVIGTHIHATDGDIGHIDDLLAEDDTWRVRYLVVDTSNWWAGKHVLVAPEWIGGFDWLGQKLKVGLDQAAIRSAPEYDDLQPVMARDREEALYRHYGRRPYWHA